MKNRFAVGIARDGKDIELSIIHNGTQWTTLGVFTREQLVMILRAICNYLLKLEKEGER
jgi:hypothetical protein